MSRKEEALEHRVVEFIGDDGCFDLSDFLDRIADAPDWSRILVAHIYLDHIFTDALRVTLPKPDIFLQSNRSFGDKLIFCRSFGCFPDDFGKLLEGINKSRNRFAHQLIFEVSDEEKKNLFRLLTSSRPVSEILEPGGFEKFLATVVIFAEAARVAFLRKAHMDHKRTELMEEVMSLLSAEFKKRK